MVKAKRVAVIIMKTVRLTYEGRSILHLLSRSLPCWMLLEGDSQLNDPSNNARSGSTMFKDALDNHELYQEACEGGGGPVSGQDGQAGKGRTKANPNVFPFESVFSLGVSTTSLKMSVLFGSHVWGCFSVTCLLIFGGVAAL